MIYDELCGGEIRDASSLGLEAILHRLAAAGAEGVILGCTEIGLLVGPESSPIYLFDTTVIHARATAEAVHRAGVGTAGTTRGKLPA